MSKDYADIVSDCIKRGKLWEDPEFPASLTSVFNQHSNQQQTTFTFEWKRPHEIVANPTFISDDFNINHGRLGDRWLTACLGCLRTSEGLLYRVVPADQGFDDRHGYAGIFRFRIWWCGEWREVMIDDRLPTVNCKLIFIHSQNSSPFWPALLEKAYAKLHGSYEVLKYGTVLDGLSDLTGGIAESIPFKNESTTGCLSLICDLLKMTTILTAKVHRESEKDLYESEKLPNGIVTEEIYRIYIVQRLETNQGEKLHLLRLKATSIAGERSRYLGGLHNLDSSTRTRIEGSLRGDGDFWMEYLDWRRTFTLLEAVHLDEDTARDEPSLGGGKIPWHLRLYHGKWQKGVTAGGCRNNVDTFHMNPRLSLSWEEKNGYDDNCDDEYRVVVMALNQHTAVDPKVIGFTAYPMPTTSSIDGKSYFSGGSNNELNSTAAAALITNNYFKSRKSLLNSQYTNSRQVSLRVRLGSSKQMEHVLVMPTTFEPGEQAAFTFRVFSKSPSIRMRFVDVVPRVVGNNVFARALIHPYPTSTVAPAIKDFSQYEPIFIQVSDDKRTVNAFELQDLLETCLPNDYIKGCASIEVCRQIVLVFDTTGLGRITFTNFKDLMCSMKVWNNVFKNWTKEKSGILKADRLKDALYEVGFLLNATVLSTIMFRYVRKDGTLRFGDFVSIILSLSVAFDAFDKRDTLQNGTVKVGRTEWLKLALSC